MGLFSERELVARTDFAIPMCGACGLAKYCDHPKMKPQGPRNARILVVGDIPSAKDDEAGEYWQGARGEALLFSLRAAGVDITEVRYTSALICASEKEDDLLAKKVPYCRPNILKEIEETQPEIIITCGKLAIEAVIGPIWKEDCGSIRQWAGWQIPGRRWNAWICPTYSPKQCVRNKDAATYRLQFDKHLHAACKIGGRPFEDRRDSKADRMHVTKCWSDSEVEFARNELSLARVISPDFETNCLKPDNKKAKIISVGFSYPADGYSLAVAWMLDSQVKVDITKELLFGGIPLIGANTKFETRWALKKFGSVINSWVWDTQTAAHVLDNRSGITSVKFQAFVRLGVEPYTNHISHHFEAKGGNTLNSIHKIPPDDLLTYNGLDCVYELEIAKKQIKQLGLTLKDVLNGSV